MQNSIAQYQTRVLNALDQLLPAAENEPTVLHQAMRYGVLTGGKRIRAALVYATGEGFNAELSDLDFVASAVELIHAYSLIHDDLPAMDNDEIRHGQPSCHKAFGEAVAILAGDTLQSLAFELLATHHSGSLNANQQISMIKILTQAIGSSGMAGGQILDLLSEGKTIPISQLENIHRLKTGALIKASVQLGAIASGCDNSKELQHLEYFAQNIGLAFQIQDDLLDVESSTAILGKTQGLDAVNQKASYPAIIGLDASKALTKQLFHQAIEHLRKLPESFLSLEKVMNFIINRNF